MVRNHITFLCRIARKYYRTTSAGSLSIGWSMIYFDFFGPRRDGLNYRVSVYQSSCDQFSTISSTVNRIRSVFTFNGMLSVGMLLTRMSLFSTLIITNRSEHGVRWIFFRMRLRGAEWVWFIVLVTRIWSVKKKEQIFFVFSNSLYFEHYRFMLIKSQFRTIFKQFE